MKLLVALWAGAAVAISAAAADPLPTNDGSANPLEVEPPLLIQPRPGGPPDEPNTAQKVVNPADPARLQAELERANRNAASGERMCRAGIISKVEAEQRGLRAVRLEAELAKARADVLKDEVVALQERFAAGEIARAELDAAAESLAHAERDAATAAAAREKAELEAALANVQRQEKLLASGSGRKADVSRAKDRVEALKAHTD